MNEWKNGISEDGVIFEVRWVGEGFEEKVSSLNYSLQNMNLTVRRRVHYCEQV